MTDDQERVLAACREVCRRLSEESIERLGEILKRQPEYLPNPGRKAWLTENLLAFERLLKELSP
jgi:hypothetical protein